jgi:hypothetical protein
MIAAQPLRFSIVILLGWACGACALVTRQPENHAGTLTVAFILDNGIQRAFGPVPLRLAQRPVPNARELPYDGGSGMTAVWLKPTAGITHLFVLTEGPGGPGNAVSLTTIPVGFPTDGIVRYREAPPDCPAQPPCVSVTGFFVDGIGESPPGPVMMWLQEGLRETSFSIPPGSSIRMRPVLTVDIARDGTLARREREYSLMIQKSAEARDVMIVAIATKPDGSLSTYDVSSALLRRSISGLPGPDENWTWRFYALDDRRELHSHCRSIKTPDYVPHASSESLYVISQQYPGFRALYPHEFDLRLQRVFEHDTKGPLVAGHFNYDPYRDFATVIVTDNSSPPLLSRADSKGSAEGKRITCFGTAMRLTFECKAEPVAITRPLQEYLVRIPPGPHQCATPTQRHRRVTTTIDSVGVVHGDGTSEFVIRNRDGSIAHCRVPPGEHDLPPRRPDTR